MSSQTTSAPLRPKFGAWVMPSQKKTLIVGIAEMVASNDTGSDLVTHALGSCLGVTIYDPIKKVGGLLHLMLPDSTIDPTKAAATPYMFVDTGVPRLFHSVFGLGGVKERLIVKVAGGAQFLDGERYFNIGERNIKSLRVILEKNSYHIHAEDVGGNFSRTLKMSLLTGEVTISPAGKTAYPL